jgi:hypothetical protein
LDDSKLSLLTKIGLVELLLRTKALELEEWETRFELPVRVHLVEQERLEKSLVVPQSQFQLERLHRRLSSLLHWMEQLE